MDTPTIQALPVDRLNDIREKVEQERKKKARITLNWFIASLGIAIILLIWANVSSSGLSFFWGVLLLFFVFSVPCLVARHQDKSYKELYNWLIVTQFIEQFNTNNNVQLAYIPWEGIQQSEFISCGLFHSVTEYSSFNLIRGKIGKTNFECAQVTAEEIREVRTNQGTRKEKLLIFNGMFFAADFNKNFAGTTLIVPDYVEGTLGRFGRSLQKLLVRSGYNGLKLAYMENPEFERAFAVYTSDQIEARYLLTPFIIQQLTELKQHLHNSDLHIAFRYGKIYIAWSTPGHWIKPPFLIQTLTREVLQETQERLLLPLQMVDYLKLNTRIWGRQ